MIFFKVLTLLQRQAGKPKDKGEILPNFSLGNTGIERASL